MRQLYDEMARLLEAGEDFVVATLFDKSGSVPRSAGAKMVVRRDGFSGTIGGGRLEAEVIALAREGLTTRRTRMHAFDLSGQDAAAMQMICGGKGEVLLDFVDAGDAGNAAVYREAKATLARAERAWLVTAIGKGGSTPPRQQCLVLRDGSLVGQLGVAPDFLAKLRAGPAKISIHAEVLDDRRVLVEPIRRPQTAIIFGAGHVSQRIAPLAASVDFRTVVLDDRPEYACRARFAEPAELLVVPSLEDLPDLGVDEDSYLVIVTRGHLHDRVVLEQALRTRAAYIGMIGSRRKRDMLFADLSAKGVSAEELARVYSPIGIDILAETPEEIAVSVVAELIRVRAEREQAGRLDGCGRGRA